MSNQEKGREYYREAAPFSVPQAEKDAFFAREMKELTEHHRRSCQAYDVICRGLSGAFGMQRQAGPYLPVSLFKDLQLASVPDEEVVRQVTSSGTTGQQVSRIYLDAPTAELQRWALCTITGDFIGGRRLPMLIIDSPDVLRDRRKFTARGAGILGFSMMSSKRFYALDENMQLNWEQIEAFLEAAKGGPSFAFGFTFMIWAYFVAGLEKEGRTLDLAGCYLIHGGGWKKLQDQKVSDDVFRETLRRTCGIRNVSDYYGMAEQTGSIFMQCEEGHLHASIYSDIEVLNPEDFSPQPEGEWGLIALRSWIPGSYPGHLLLTEDWGRVLGTDDCPCGRKGRYFEISGRIRKAEIRGCSDTFAQDRQREAAGAGQEGGAAGTGQEGGAAGGGPAGSGGLSSEAEVLCGEAEGAFPKNRTPLESFDPLVMDFLEDLSHRFMKDPAYRAYTDIYALGFWCRRAHMEKIRSRQKASPRRGKGFVLHIAPSNMPAMFAYSWITSLLAGNANAVRISSRESVITDTILQGIRSLMAEDKYRELRERNVFLRFPRGDEALQELSAKAAARMIWGGDATVAHISSIPAAEDAVDIPFPDKYSFALADAEYVSGLEDEELRRQANLFCRDTYGADQNACSSPRSIFWQKGSMTQEELERAKDRFWSAVSEEAKRYELQPHMATEKYRMLCRAYAEDPRLQPVKMRTNRLYVVPCGRASDFQGPLPEARLGIFFEFDLESAEDLMPFMQEKIQTAVCLGVSTEQLTEAVRRSGMPGLDRAVLPGEALEFDTVWDRKDLIELLSGEDQ